MLAKMADLEGRAPRAANLLRRPGGRGLAELAPPKTHLRDTRPHSFEVSRFVPAHREVWRLRRVVLVQDLAARRGDRGAQDGEEFFGWPVGRVRRGEENATTVEDREGMFHQFSIILSGAKSAVLF